MKAVGKKLLHEVKTNLSDMTRLSGLNNQSCFSLSRRRQLSKLPGVLLMKIK
jgi:hypothetical protein